MVRWIILYIKNRNIGDYGYFFRRLVILQLLISFILFLIPVFVSNVSAAKRRVIFQLANLQQWTELGYTFAGNSYRGDLNQTSLEHEFDERYHLEIDYAILGRRLANGSLEFEVGLQQGYEDESGLQSRNDSSNGFNLEYNIDMLLFEKRFYPISLYSSRSQDRVNAPFTKSYDLTSSHYSTEIALKNQFLPVRLHYHFHQTETTGLEVGRLQRSEQLRLNAFIDTAEISTTELQVQSGKSSSQVSGTAPELSTDDYGIEARNVLDWLAFSQHQVMNSSYRKQHSIGASNLLSEQWDERLRLRLGKALETGASYGYSKSESDQQFRRTKKREGWLRHQLFQSVTSRFQHSISNTAFLSGDEDLWKRQFNLSYSKLLPKDSRIFLTYGYSYGETDRDLTEQKISVIGEKKTVQIDGNYLTQFDVETDSVEVFSQDRSILYTEGIDYLLIPNGRRLELVFPLPFPTPGGINLNDSLSIDYAYRVNNSIEYATTVNSVSASLELLNNAFRLYGNASETSQDLIAGEANVSPLVQQRYYQAGFEFNLNEYSLGGSYSFLDSTIAVEEYVEAFCNFQREKKNSLFNLRLIERFSSVQQNESLLDVKTESTKKNSLLLHLNYRRQLNQRTSITLKGFLADIRGEETTQNEVSVGFLLESRWYKFLLRASTDISLQYYDERTTQNGQITLALRRYF